MTDRNIGVFQGHSSRLPYDKCAYNDKLSESVAPLGYYLDQNRIHNCNSCMPTFGPVPSNNTGAFSTSTMVGNVPNPGQQLVDLESIMTNRNIRTSKCRDAQINDIDVFKFQTKSPQSCNQFLNPLATHLTNPPINYRSITLNRFYDMPSSNQEVIFWPFSQNTQLEARDNYFERIPKIKPFDAALPLTNTEQPKKCLYRCQ